MEPSGTYTVWVNLLMPIIESLAIFHRLVTILETDSRQRAFWRERKKEKKKKKKRDKNKPKRKHN